jgi:2-C-methyl-D-erythritol 4-phosphate cytidylyltransferase/2-C-methyl-D-erythritol 2,4-cyclodiphosphate synthase
MSGPRTVAILVAAGVGVRAGGDTPKQYRSIAGKPMIRWSLEALSGHEAIARVVAVISPEHAALFEAAASGLHKVETTFGGAERTASVRAGFDRVGPDAEIVLIHDAARPGMEPHTIDALILALQTADGAAPAMAMADALKQVDAAGSVLPVKDRASFRRVQTPQAFRAAAFGRALAIVPRDAVFDDDLALAGAAGLSCVLVAGSHRLMKATYPEDFTVLERMLEPPRMPLVGSGFDAHRFGPGEYVTLCGIRIPHSAGLIGHSDADAAWHALTDALLGAIGAGDIGDHFPPSDPQWRGAASEIFLVKAADLVRQRGGKIANVDLTLMCERPKIKPHREAMRGRTAEVLGLPLARVSVKATTTEGLGFLGRDEGLAAQASVCVLAPWEADDV